MTYVTEHRQRKRPKDATSMIRAQISCFFLQIVSLSISCFMLLGCATTTLDNKRTSADDILPVPNLSDPDSCKKVGFAYCRKAWNMHIEKSANREDIQKLYARGIELIERSMNLYMEQMQKPKYIEKGPALILAYECLSAKAIYENEPHVCRAYYEKAIRYLTYLLDKFQMDQPYRRDELEYYCARLYFLTGDLEKAFQMADKAWGDGYKTDWNQEFWTWLKKCIEQKKMTAKYFPPLPPASSFSFLDWLLFPLNLVADVVTDTLVYIVYSPYAIIKHLLTSDEPGWAIPGVILWPYGLICSFGLGIYDAWESFPFWNTTIIRFIKNGGDQLNSYDYFYDNAP